MSTVFELSTINRHDDYGDFNTALYVLEGSTSDDERAAGVPSITEPRDVLMAVPLLVWIPKSEEPDSIVETIAMLQAKCLDAVEQGTGVLPMKQDATPEVEFEFREGFLQLRSGTRNLGLLGELKFRIEDRLEWFLTRGRTLAIAIRTPSRTWVATVASDGGPLVAVLKGSTASKHFGALVQHSGDWNFARLGNPSLFPDAADAADQHYRAYSAAPARADLPRLIAYGGGGCLGCGARGGNREHCIPNWIASEQGVMPVVAPVFCSDCNGHFGRTLEAPLADLVRGGQLRNHLRGRLFTTWAIKTAIALSAASDVRVDTTWTRDLRNGQVPAGFEVFATTEARRPPGYDFAVTHFSETERRAGLFLASFAMDGLVFYVARASPALDAIAGVPRTHPAYRPATSAMTELDLARLHGDLITGMTGQPMVFLPSSMKPVTVRSTGQRRRS